MTIDPAKVAIYIRWSTEDQSDGTTLEVQSETCRAYLVSQGWAVNEDLVFIDDGYSGGTLDRPAITKLRQAIANGQVDCIVVYKLDRLSRSVVDTVNLVCREWEDRCSIKSAREPIDTTSHAGRMFFYTLVNYAEWERSVIKERTYSGKIRRAQEGKNPGFRPPFGYSAVDGGRFEVLPDEVVIVQRIYRDYLAGMGARVIAQSLARDGIKPRFGKVWCQTSVSKILKNPAYIGRLEYGRRKVVGGKRVKKDPSVVVENSLIPPIITREDWDAVQAVKDSRPGFGRGKGSGRSNVSESLLTGILKCRCGSGFSGRSYSTKAGEGLYQYYRCHGAHSKGPAFCKCGGIRQDLLDSMVVQALRTLYGGEQAKERLVRQVLAKWEVQLAEARGSLRNLEKDLGKLDEGERNLKRLLRNSDISIGEYREMKEDSDREAADLREAHDRAKNLERQALAGLRSQSRLLESLSQVDGWEQLPHLSQKHLLKQFIEEIRVYRPIRTDEVDCHILWRWDSSTAGEKPHLPTRFEVAQPHPLPPRNNQRDTSGRFTRAK